ncbi:MAG: alpha/beta hydrolase [Nitriliruptoraceae bacterium]
MPFVTLAGVDVHHVVAGPVDAPAVLLLHHYHGNVATWRHVIAGLADTHRVIAFDRPGFGHTQRPRRGEWRQGNPYTREATTRIAVQLLDHLGVDRAVLIGASAGGTIALETFARYPGRVEGLALIGPAISGDPGPAPRLRPVLRTPPARAALAFAARRARRELGAERIGRWWHDPSRVSDEDVAIYRDAVSQPGWARALVETMVSDAPPDLRSLLPRVDVPTLVVAGASDRRVRPEWNRRTAEAIPVARFVLLDGVGHTPHEERPDLFVEALRPLLHAAHPSVDEPRPA